MMKLSLKLLALISILGLAAIAHKADPSTGDLKAINAPYIGTCIIKRNLDIHQMNCEIQPNNIAVIYQR
jgi:hypothetical protein